MRYIAYLIYLSLLFSCIRKESKTTTHVVGISQASNDTLTFVNSRKYIFSDSKTKIPAIVIDSLSIVNNEIFKIGDNSDINKINFSDARLEGLDEYNRKLHFVLVSDTFCLLTYRQGGIGVMDVIDYIQYKGKFCHTRQTSADLSDTIKLKYYLENYPVIICK